MKIAILGQGGREQALAQTCLKSKKVTSVYVIPGNAGMKLMGLNCVESMNEEETVEFCRTEQIDLVIPGNEAVILSSIKSLLAHHNIDCFSPDPEIARLESSKVFCKKILKQAGLLTADFELIDDLASGIFALNQHNFKSPIVLKADGLAQGKGVWVCADLDSAQKYFNELVKKFGFPILFEKCLVGTELSAFAICDGDQFSLLGTAVDYKRVTPDPFSANTGGMGAYSPCDFISSKDNQEIVNIFEQSLKTIQQNGMSYRGFLFAGLMKTESGMAVIEFNVRLGDPETQALLPRLESDLIELISGQERVCEVSSKSAVHVVFTSDGYPTDKMSLGHPLIFNRNRQVYFSGVQDRNGQLNNSGGRVLGITALGSDLKAARQLAYEHVKEVDFKGAYFRKDIGL